VTTENLKSASTVLTEFLSEQSNDEALDVASVSAIVSLRKENKLTKTNLLRQLEEARTAELKDDTAAGE
jgi:hypothetical protein